MKTRTLKAPVAKGSQIQNYLLNALTAHGWLAVRFNSGARKIGKSYFRAYIVHAIQSSAGFPDVCAFRNSQAILIEVKMPGEAFLQSQKRFAIVAARFGVRVHVVRSFADVDNLMAEVSA